jgi:hypothetical protein
MGITENISLMEPMLPPEGRRELEDLALDLATKASGLASQLPPALRRSIGDLVRSMNCCYSNLIEGHDTHPRDIDRALSHANYSADPRRGRYSMRLSPTLRFNGALITAKICRPIQQALRTSCGCIVSFAAAFQKKCFGS